MQVNHVEEWQHSGACNGLPSRMFFPQRGESPRPAKRVCSGCPVKNECLAYARRTGIRHGIFGGLTPKEREELA
jgi:WhiB family redox-sensing transcriptional regulator